MSISAYRKTIVATERPRDMERRIFSEINAALVAHKDHHDNAETKAERLTVLSGSLRPALAKNLKLWTALRMDLMLPQNELPEATRAQLINLSIFVERHTNNLLGGKGTVGALIDINTSIMAGLAGHAEAA